MWKRLDAIMREESNPMYIFILSIFCTLLGIITATFLFQRDAGLFAVFFASLALLPIIDKVISSESMTFGSRKIVKGDKIYLTEIYLSQKLNPVRLLSDYKEIFSIYIVIFLAVFLVFSMYASFMPAAEQDSFSSLLSLISGRATALGEGTFHTEFFYDIVSHNLLIVVIAFLFSLIYGSGAVFIVGLNAATWGVVFANFSAGKAAIAGANPFLYLALILLIVIWHVVLEGGAYVSASISGSIISKWFSIERKISERLSAMTRDGLIILLFSMVLVLVAALVETIVAPVIASI